MSFTEIDSPERTRYIVASPYFANEQTNLAEEFSPLAGSLSAGLRELRDYYQESLLGIKGLDPKKSGITRIAEYWDNGVPFVYIRLFPIDRTTNQDTPNSPGSLPYWRNFARDILSLSDDDVVWDTGPVIRAELIDSLLADSNLSFKPLSEKRTLGNRTIILDQWPLVRVNEGTPYYEFADPNIYFLLLASNYIGYKIEDYDKNVLEKLERDGLLGRDKYAKILPALSFIAEEIFVRHTDDFENFILGLAEKIGSEEGFAASAAIIEDLTELYKPYFAFYSNVNMHGISQEKLTATYDKLKNKYCLWRYQTRQEIVSKELRALALTKMQQEADPIKGFYAYLERIFLDTTQGEKLKEILSAKDLETASWLFERVLSEKKMEAGLIPVAAHLLGYQDRERLGRITLLMQILWKAILTGDDTIDQSPERRGEKAFHRVAGIANGIQIPQFVKELVLAKLHEPPFDQDPALARAASAMQARLDRGDIRNRSHFGWETDFSVLHENMTDIMQVISWFSQYAAETVRFNQATALNLARALENFGCLLLINNDAENFYIASPKAGDDIGKRKNSFMWAFNRSAEIPESIRAEFRSLCDDPEIAKKVDNFESLDQADVIKLRRAVELGNSYFGEAIRSMERIIRNYYEDCKRYLTLFFEDKLISSDSSNQEYRKVLEQSLEGIWQKFEPYFKK